MHRSVILVGDVTDHGGVVLTGGNARYDGKLIARVGDTVSCPTHGDNKIVGGGGAASVGGQPIATEGMATACGSHLIASQTMFNTDDSPRSKDGSYQPRWDKTSPLQRPDSGPGAGFPDPYTGPQGVSPNPPDNIPS